MASNINPYNVDGTFPIAGQDNSSQGFRDNFTNIQNNFAFAEAEISDLQSKAILSSALTGQTLVNDMAGTQIRRPQLTAWTQSLLDVGSISGTASLDFNQANFQKITTASPITLSFINWPSSVGAGALGYGVMRVWIVVTNVAHTVTLPSAVDIAVGDIAGYNSSTNTITFDAAGNYIFDFSSIDGGTDYQIFDVTRNRSSLRDPNIYFNPAVTSAPTLFVGYGAKGVGGLTALNIALAGDQGQNTISAAGSYNSAAVGNLTLGNITNATLDTGKIGGYTITSARGNLALGSVLPVQSGDYLGYHNSVAYTGQGGTANVFQQLSSIVYYATGSNVAYGLGGNIAFFTADDGGNSGNVVLQAVGIENNQMFKTFAGIAEVGTYVLILPTGGGSFTANAFTSTLIIDSSLEATIAYANITLPSNPVNGQRIKISSVAPITNANINAPSMAAIKYVPTNKFSSGNIAIALTYMSATSTWYVA